MMLATRSQTNQLDLADTLLLIAQAEEMRRSLKKFVIAAWPYVDPAPYVDGWVVDAICDHLTALTKGQIRFLLINVPPRHSKSTICSVLWPVWDWLQKPEDRFLCASYSLNLAIRDNLKKRNLIESSWFQSHYGQDFNIASEHKSLVFLREKEFTLTRDQNAKRFFMNDKMGYQLATSVCSSTTGEGGSILLIDDAHSASEAHSDVERESANTWFREVWSNRMNDARKDCMLVIGQRIHESDVSGIIINERPDWIHLNLPAEFEEARACKTYVQDNLFWQDPRQKEGDLLWTERFDQKTLDRYKRDLGALGFAAQYQQTPVPASGGIFKQVHERFFIQNLDHYFLQTPLGIRAIAKSDCELFLTVDPAISESKNADYTAIGVWVQTPYKDLLLLDLRRGHWSHADQQEQIIEVFNEYKADFIAVETVAYQAALFQDLSMKGIPCRPFVSKKDKVFRANGAAIWHQNGKLYFLKSASWLADYQKELYKFPRAVHDDQVDVTSLACIVIRSRGPLSDEDWAEPVPDSIENQQSEILQSTEISITEQFVPINTNDVFPEFVVSPKVIDPFEYATQVFGSNW